MLDTALKMEGATPVAKLVAICHAMRLNADPTLKAAYSFGLLKSFSGASHYQVFWALTELKQDYGFDWECFEDDEGDQCVNLWIADPERFIAIA